MAEAEPPIEEVPSKRGSKRPPGYCNLQENHADHEEVGALIVKSKTSWLSAEEISKILKQAESKNLTVSGEKPPRGSKGLFIYEEEKFYDHWMWNDVSGSKRKRRGVSIMQTYPTRPGVFMTSIFSPLSNHNFPASFSFYGGDGHVFVQE